MNTLASRTTRPVLALAALGAIAFAIPAHGSPAATAAPTLTIGGDEVQPRSIDMDDGYAFVLRNGSAGIARVEFDLPRGSGIACSPRGRTPRLDRRFVLEEGESLVCHAKRGSYDFTAYHSVRTASGDFEMNRTEGTIRIS